MSTDTPVYPITRPAAGGGDARFSSAWPSTSPPSAPPRLPPLTTGADLVRLQMTLFNPIYQEKKR